MGWLGGGGREFCCKTSSRSRFSGLVVASDGGDDDEEVVASLTTTSPVTVVAPSRCRILQWSLIDALLEKPRPQMGHYFTKTLCDSAQKGVDVCMCVYVVAAFIKMSALMALHIGRIRKPLKTINVASPLRLRCVHLASERKRERIIRRERRPYLVAPLNSTTKGFLTRVRSNMSLERHIHRHIHKGAKELSSSHQAK